MPEFETGMKAPIPTPSPKAGQKSDFAVVKDYTYVENRVRLKAQQAWEREQGTNTGKVEG